MYRKILYPVDGSELSTAALPHVVALAEATGAPVVVVQAVEIVTEADAMTVPERRTEAEASTGRTARALEAAGVAVEATHVIEGDAGRSIVTAADEEAADIIVMATQGRSGLRRLALGSVAEYVMVHAGRPVLLVRPPHED